MLSVVSAFSVVSLCEASRTTHVPPTTTVFTSYSHKDFPGQGGYRTMPVKKKKILAADGTDNIVVGPVPGSRSSSARSPPETKM